MNKHISIILPIYNEESNIPLLYQKIISVCDSLPYTFEFIFINDGSTDRSWQIIKQLAQQNNLIKGISFSRNFGHQIALKAGYEIATGDAVITMDADLQHPPSMISVMLEHWQQGSNIVYVKRVQRNDGLLKKMASCCFYRVIDAIAQLKIPRHVNDFRLVDKKVVAVLNQFNEHTPYWRGLVAWTGFNYSIIECKYDNRHSGKSGYTWHKMFKLAFDGITAFSLFPLKIAAFIGSFALFSGLCIFSYLIINVACNHGYYPLITWLMVVVYLFMGIQFLLLWLLGEYIGRMFVAQKERPFYIVSESINLAPEKKD